MLGMLVFLRPAAQQRVRTEAPHFSPVDVWLVVVRLRLFAGLCRARVEAVCLSGLVFVRERYVVITVV